MTKNEPLNYNFIVQAPQSHPGTPKTIYLELSTTDPKCYIFLESLGPDLHPPTFRSPSGQNGPVSRNTGGEVSRFAKFFFNYSTLECFLLFPNFLLCEFILYN